LLKKRALLNHSILLHLQVCAQDICLTHSNIRLTRNAIRLTRSVQRHHLQRPLQHRIFRFACHQQRTVVLQRIHELSRERAQHEQLLIDCQRLRGGAGWVIGQNLWNVKPPHNCSHTSQHGCITAINGGAARVQAAGDH